MWNSKRRTPVFLKFGTLPGNGLQTQILRPHIRLTDSETLWVILVHATVWERILRATSARQAMGGGTMLLPVILNVLGVLPNKVGWSGTQWPSAKMMSTSAPRLYMSPRLAYPARQTSIINGFGYAEATFNGGWSPRCLPGQWRGREKQSHEGKQFRVPTKPGHEWTHHLCYSGLSNTSGVKSHTLQGKNISLVKVVRQLWKGKKWVPQTFFHITISRKHNVLCKKP